LILHRVGELVHLGANRTGQANNRARVIEMAKESTRKDRMRVLIAIAEPVQCALTGAGRKECERSFRKRLSNVAARGGPDFGCRAHVRVAPASVDEQDLRLRARNSYLVGDRGQQQSKWLLPPFPGALRGSISRQQRKFATDPTGVPTEIDHREIAVLERSGEAVERLLESWAVRVDHKLRGESELRQSIMDGTGIANRPDNTLELSIVRYADHECTALGLGGSGAVQRQNGQ
jgi:hypothetical protein